jgi:hypothetical protein
MIFNSINVNVAVNGKSVSIAPIDKIETERDFVQPMQRLLDRFHGKSSPFKCVSKEVHRASFESQDVKIDFKVDLTTFQYRITSNYISAVGFGASELYQDMIKLVDDIYGNRLVRF